MTGWGDEGMDVKDLLASTEMAKAALLIRDSFEKKMEEVRGRFSRMWAMF